MLSTPPDYWYPEWLERHKRNRKMFYPTQEEIDAKKKKEELLKQESLLKEKNRKENNLKDLNNWINCNMKNIDESKNYDSRLRIDMGFIYDPVLHKEALEKKISLKLYNLLSRKYKISIPKIDLTIKQKKYLIQILNKEEDELNRKKYIEERKIESEKFKKRMEMDEIYRKKELEKEKVFSDWLINAQNIVLKPRIFKNDKSKLNTFKRDINKMKKMSFFRYIFNKSKYENFSDEQLVHIFRVKQNEDKILKKKKEIEKVDKFKKKEELLKEECNKLNIEYKNFNKLPGKQWTNSKKWNDWYDLEVKRINLLNDKKREAIKLLNWNKLSDSEKKEIFDFRKKYVELEKEKLSKIYSANNNYYNNYNNYNYSHVNQYERYASATGHTLTIDPKWSAERRREEIRNFNEAIRDF